MEKKVLLLAKKLESEMVSWRRTLHRNPELSFEEYETTSFIAEKLSEFGCENIKIGFGPISTGLTAEIGSSLPGPAVALRADIDALPIHEETNHECALMQRRHLSLMRARCSHGDSAGRRLHIVGDEG